MHAIIIGGGLAGPLTALGLEKAGIRSTLYEAYPEGASVGVGAWLTVAVNGLAAMRTLGVADAVMARGFPSRAIELASGTGKLLGTVPIGGELADGTVTHTLKRADLHACLLEAVAARGIPVLYGKRFASVTPHADDADVRFEDGTTARGEVVIGADGIWSSVRRAIDPDAKPPRYTGLGNIGGFTPASAVALPRGTYRMIFGKRAFFGYTTTPEGDTWWFANPPSKAPVAKETLASMDTAAWKAHLVSLFTDDEGPMRALIEGAEGELVGMNQFDLASVRAWHDDRVVLVGDAAHAASPSSGQGVSMAAEDAVILALCLRDVPDVALALTHFARLRRARAERVVAYGTQFANEKAAGPVARVFRDLFMPFFLKSLSGEKAKRDLAWLYDHDVDWSARVA